MPKSTQHIMAIFCNRGSLMVASASTANWYILKCDDERRVESANVCHFYYVLPLVLCVFKMSCVYCC